jgi:ribonuclease P protein component
LTATARYFLKKEDKLKSRKAIDELFKKGKNFSGFPLKVIWLPQNRLATLQAGVGVSSRNFKKAADRNRIKRLMREAWRLQKSMLHDQLEENQSRMSVFFLYVGKELPPYALIFEKMGTAIKKLTRLSNEKPETNS